MLSGEYTRMQDTFRNLGFGLIGASVLIYFLMVGLDKSWVVPLTVMLIVPICLVGILPALYFTGTAVNVQSLLGFHLRGRHQGREYRAHDRLRPGAPARGGADPDPGDPQVGVDSRQAGHDDGRGRVRALIPGALALERGSEANAPLARAILGGLLAGEPATLFVLPCLYSLMVRDKPGAHATRS